MTEFEKHHICPIYHNGLSSTLRATRIFPVASAIVAGALNLVFICIQCGIDVILFIVELIQTLGSFDRCRSCIFFLYV